MHEGSPPASTLLPRSQRLLSSCSPGSVASATHRLPQPGPLPSTAPSAGCFSAYMQPPLSTISITQNDPLLSTAQCATAQPDARLLSSSPLSASAAHPPMQPSRGSLLHDSTDVVAVSPLHPEGDRRASLAYRRTAFINRLVAAEVRVESTLSRDCDEVLLCLSAPDSRLERRAEQIEMEKRLRSGGYADFSSARKHEFAPASASSFFTSLERQRLLLSIVEGQVDSGCCGVDLAELVEDKVLSAVVPIHDSRDIDGPDGLLAGWVLSRRCALDWRHPDASLADGSTQPLDKIRDYFGEKARVQHGGRLAPCPPFAAALWRCHPPRPRPMPRPPLVAPGGPLLCLSRERHA